MLVMFLYTHLTNVNKSIVFYRVANEYENLTSKCTRILIRAVKR